MLLLLTRNINLKGKSRRELSRTVDNFSFITFFSFASENV